LSTPRIVIVGSNHECASVDLRERLAFTGDTLSRGLHALREHVDEGLIVSTCNRTELYVVTDDEDTLGRERVYQFLTRYHDMPAHVLDEMSYAHMGQDAVCHMFRVASGLDSMVLGEPQILSQIRDALDAARTAGSAGPYLQRLATDALKVGKRARTDTHIARNKLSISHAAAELAFRERPELAGLRVAILGAGKMASIAARVLTSRGVDSLTIVNRSLEKAEALAAQTGATARPLAELSQVMADSDVVIGAVLTDEPLVSPEMTSGRTLPLLLIDLGVPRVIARGCDDDPLVSLRDVDDLERVVYAARNVYADEIDKVEGLVQRAADDYLGWTRSRKASAAIGQLRRHCDEVRAAEVERAMRRLGHLSERDQNVVRAMAKGLTNTLMHQPVQSLREAASEDDVRCILESFGIERERPDGS
jgi:glutamyl-tRNA reductase